MAPFRELRRGMLFDLKERMNVVDREYYLTQKHIRWKRLTEIYSNRLGGFPAQTVDIAEAGRFSIKDDDRDSWDTPPSVDAIDQHDTLALMEYHERKKRGSKGSKGSSSKGSSVSRSESKTSASTSRS